MSDQPVPSTAFALPRQPDGHSWPTVTWATAPQRSGDPERVENLLDTAFDPAEHGRLGEHRAVLIVQDGRIVAERYGPGLESAQSFAYVLFEDDHGGVVVGRVRLRRGWFGGGLVVGDHAEDLDECGYGRIVVGEVAHHSDRAQEVAQTCFSGRC